MLDDGGAELGTLRWSCFTVHYTPKHGSWLNQAELEIGLFARQCLGKRRIADLATLKSEARAWNRQINRRRTLIQWKFSRQDARNVLPQPGEPIYAVRELEASGRAEAVGKLEGGRCLIGDGWRPNAPY